MSSGFTIPHGCKLNDEGIDGLVSSTSQAKSVNLLTQTERPEGILAKLATSQELLPGLLLVLVVSVVARIASHVSGFVPDAVIGLVLGALIKNSVGVHAMGNAGIKFTQRYLLRAAIILLGASLSFGAIVGKGGEALPVILTCLVVSFSLSLLLARIFGLSDRVGTLLGTGTAICGATAILTVGPLIPAAEAEVAYAIGTIFSYNTLALIFYPYIGHALHLSNTSFGTWAGTAVNDTSAVVATGLIYSTRAGQVATVVKLTRTVLLVPMAVGIGMFFALREGRSASGKINVWKMMPWFVLGFLGMAVLNTLNVFPAPVIKDLTQTAQFLIVMVLASVGLGMSIGQIRKMGAKPLLIGLFVGTVMGFVSMGLIYAFGIA